MRMCGKCKREKFCFDSDRWAYISIPLIQVFGKWICLECLLRSGGRKSIKKAKTKLRKRIAPKSIQERWRFKKLEEVGFIKIRKRWVMEDLNRVYESYQVLKPLWLWGRNYLKLDKKPKKGQMIWREVVYREELEK